MISKIKQLDGNLRTILPDTSLPQVKAKSLSEETLQNTSINLSSCVVEIEEWIQGVEQTIKYETNTLRNNLKQLESEIKNLDRAKVELTTLTKEFTHQRDSIQKQAKELQDSIKERERLEQLIVWTGVEEQRGKNALPGLKTWLYQFIMKNMLENASPYLKEFTDGRLDFVFADKEKTDTISIVDYTYGKIRNVNDLSGGEKFMAALSLALGLTDLLIQFEKNAVRPNFMFIDEGFGTLDTERLRKVVAQLKHYAEKHDIMLGVVSHRQEMHEMAPVRLHVTHDRTGKGSQVRPVL